MTKNWEALAEQVNSANNRLIDELAESELSRTELIKQNQAIAVENERLEAVIKAAQEQKPTHVVDWEYYDEDRDDPESRGDLVIHDLTRGEFEPGTYLYANPVPAQSPAVAVPDVNAAFEAFLDRLGGAESDAWHDYLCEQIFKDGFHAARAAAPSHDIRPSAPTDSGIAELDLLCAKYNSGEIDIVTLTSRIWNTAYFDGQKFGEILGDRCPSHEPVTNAVDTSKWESCNQACDREFGGYKDRTCNCEAALAAMNGAQDSGVVDHE